MRDNRVGDIVPHQLKMPAKIVERAERGDRHKRENEAIFDRGRGFLLTKKRAHRRSCASPHAAQNYAQSTGHLAFPIINVPKVILDRNELRMI